MQADETFADPKVEGTFITSESRAKAHEYIKEQIKSYESIIRYYKNRQNTLTITCRIPPEVLACIFRYFVKDAVGDNADPDTHSKKIDWIRAVSHICSHWREVALSTPSLWSTIDLGYAPAFALEMLQRSKNVPLSVINAGDVSRKAFPHKQKRSEGGAPTIEVILPALRNLGEVQVQVLQSLRLDQVVSLEVNGNECHERVWSLIGNLPQLEELQVYRRYTQTIVETLLQPKTIQDTTDLSFPALTVLGINDCHFYDHESDMGRLYDSIELRRDAELPLKRLTISNCDGMLYGQLDDLEQIIDEVIWDQSGAIDNEDEDMYF
ncbi:hypothetical protein H0H92_004701 [Tricholoma furcatifolium]|nr:hypothetical protein H0H92_004701 [Tricholoma furcatifolium]